VTPTHHPAEEALVEYVAGAMSEAAALAFACHVSLCTECARRLGELESVGGALLEGGAGEGLPSDALALALAKLDEPGGAVDAADAPAPALPAFLAPYRLPAPLARHVAAFAAGARWRFRVPGVRAIELPTSASSSASLSASSSSSSSAGEGGPRVQLVAFKPGVTIPPHGHGGTEHVVVFSGAIEEDGRRFARGDIATRAVGERHEQRIAAGEPCIALVVNEGPLVPLTLRGRLLLAIARA
jgi:putative transcriptional regulator